MPKTVDERQLTAEEQEELDSLADNIFASVPVPNNPEDPVQVVAAIGHFVDELRTTGFDNEALTDWCFLLGSRLGKEMISVLGWDWVHLTFVEDGFSGYAVAEPDRAHVVFPMNNIYSLLTEPDLINNILLLFNMLRSGNTGPLMPPKSYLSLG